MTKIPSTLVKCCYIPKIFYSILIIKTSRLKNAFISWQFFLNIEIKPSVVATASISLLFFPFIPESSLLMVFVI